MPKTATKIKPAPQHHGLTDVKTTAIDPDGAQESAAAPSAKAKPVRSVKVGEVVRQTAFDPYVGAGGRDVTRVGVVVEAGDGHARVAWFDSLSDPVPVDELDD